MKEQTILGKKKKNVLSKNALGYSGQIWQLHNQQTAFLLRGWGRGGEEFNTKCYQVQNKGILKGEVSLYCWPPVWLVWISLFCK